MSMPPLKFTNAGKALQLKALAGAELKFTRIGLGDGQLTGKAPATLKTLIHETVSVDITTKTRTADYLTLAGYFDKSKLVAPFWWRELGPYALDPDEGEILYAYANAFEEGEYLEPDGQLLERIISVGVVVGDAANVTAVLSESLLYATRDPETGKVYPEQLPDLNVTAAIQAHDEDPGAHAGMGWTTQFGPVTVMVPLSGWSAAKPWSQTVAVAGVTAADDGLGVYPVDVADDGARKLYEKAYGCLAPEAETGADSVTLTCRDGKPETNFQVIVKGVR